jgi:hypothetical protein
MLISIALNIVSLLLFAHTQRSLRRRQQRGELSNTQRTLLRSCAWLLLLLAWFGAAHSLGPQLGSLFWLAALGISGLIVPVVLALRHAATAPPERQTRVRGARYRRESTG